MGKSKQFPWQRASQMAAPRGFQSGARTSLLSMCLSHLGEAQLITGTGFTLFSFSPGLDFTFQLFLVWCLCAFAVFLPDDPSSFQSCCPEMTSYPGALNHGTETVLTYSPNEGGSCTHLASLKSDLTLVAFQGQSIYCTHMPHRLSTHRLWRQIDTPFM